jgi:S-DNA-T family DNA segregation ATPase FtsK/SpoIIIE
MPDASEVGGKVNAAATQQQLFRSPDGPMTRSPDHSDRLDPLFEDAVKLTRQARKGSTSVLQRGLRIGYGRAVQLIDQMERAGIVGPENGLHPRRLRREKSQC